MKVFIRRNYKSVVGLFSKCDNYVDNNLQATIGEGGRGEYLDILSFGYVTLK